MTFTHDDIKNRLIEFLYGELEGEARAAFDAHLAGCEPCRAEVAGFQQTRAVARAAVRAGLDEPVPAGVRARVLEAAAAAATANGHAATARVAAEAAKKLPKGETSKGEASGPFAWLRARWTLPMFATVAAMGALLLVRETIYREARKPLGDTVAPEAPAPSVAPPAMPPLERLKAAKAEADEAPVMVKKRERRESPVSGGSGGLSVPLPAAEPKPTAAHKAAKASSPSRKGSGGRVASASAPSGAPVMDPDGGGPQKPRPPKGSLDDLMEGPLKPRSGTTKSEAAGASAPRDSLLSLQKDKSDTRGFAQPPPPPAPAAAAPMPRAPAAAPAAPRARPAAESTMSADDYADEAPRSEKKARKRSESEEEEGAPLAGGAPATTASRDLSDQKSDDGRQAPDPAAPLAARAEKLMASQKWAEAAAAYRQLIARFPKHEQVPNWKRRLSVVEAAAARAK